MLHLLRATIDFALKRATSDSNRPLSNGDNGRSVPEAILCIADFAFTHLHASALRWSGEGRAMVEHVHKRINEVCEALRSFDVRNRHAIPDDIHRRRRPF